MAKKLGPLARKVLDKVKTKAKPSRGLQALAAPEPSVAPQAPDSAAEAVSKMGRPSIYDPSYTALVEELCQRGATDQELAEFFDVSMRTINRWKVLHAPFALALRRGKDVSDDRMELSLYHRGMGFELEKQVPIKLKRITYGEDGKKAEEVEEVQLVTVREQLPPDPTSMIFWLKNRRGDRWRDVHKVEHGRANEFDQMSMEDLRAAIALQAKEIVERDPTFTEAQVLLPPPPIKKGKR